MIQDLPQEGSVIRAVFDLLMRPQGADQAEIDALLKAESAKSFERRQEVNAYLEAVAKHANGGRP